MKREIKMGQLIFIIINIVAVLNIIIYSIINDGILNGLLTQSTMWTFTLLVFSISIVLYTSISIVLYTIILRLIYSDYKIKTSIINFLNKKVKI